MQTQRDSETEVQDDIEINSPARSATEAIDLTEGSTKFRTIKSNVQLSKRKTRFKFPSCLISLYESCKLETIFYEIGKFVGSYPVAVMMASFLLCVAMGSGLFLWHEETNDLENFVPLNSPIRADAAWVEEHFRDELRYESIIVTADNVLSADVLQTIADIDSDVRGINISGGYNWSDVCARYLTYFEREGKKSILDDMEITQHFKSFKIDFTNDCIYQSILRLWSDEDSLQNLTTESITNKISYALNISNKALPVLYNVRPLLSNLKLDTKRSTVSASATLMTYMLAKTNNHSADWELEFIERTLRTNRSLPPSMKIFASTNRSYNDALQEVLTSNLSTLFCGFSLIIVYITVVMGRMNFVEQRIYLSLFGTLIVLKSIIASFGFCFYVGFSYGPIHPILPFLLLGIGVDDMFIIIQSHDNLSPAEKKMSVPERIGRTMRQAGASITVTSLTDIVAFAVGTTTIMPSLQSFCFFAVMGIFFLYIFVSTFFVSCLAIDENRKMNKRDGCCCCFKHSNNWKPNDCSQYDFQKTFFRDIFSRILLIPTVKFLVITLTFVLMGFNIWCCFKVEQKFDPIWYLNADSYPLQFTNALKQYFPNYEKRAGVYIGAIDYFAEKENLENLIYQLGQNPFIKNETISFWYKDFHYWMENQDYDPENEAEFRSYLSEYLFFTKEGMTFMKDMKFDRFPYDEYNITASQIQIQHISMNTTAEQVQAMKSIRDLINSINFTTGNGEDLVAFSYDYVSWTANQVIGEELIKNLTITIVAVASVTIILLRNLRTSIFVILCVCLTLIDLVGSMYLFGLTIEISTSIVIILCVGLAVDYSAHIGHKFTTLQGNRDERARDTLALIGPAVLNGGFSTVLAFVVLSNSDSYIFKTFFKLFFSVVAYGLFHGLFFLPVVLSVFGPETTDKRASWSEKLFKTQYQNGTLASENVANDVELRMIPSLDSPQENSDALNNYKGTVTSGLSNDKINRTIHINSSANNSQSANLLRRDLQPYITEGAS